VRFSDAATQVLTGAAVAWLPAESSVVYTQCWREEGGGDGCVVKWERRPDRKITRTMAVFSPGEADTEAERRARLVAARNAIGTRLDGASLLLAQTWADGARSVRIGAEQQLTWDPEQSALSVAGRAPGKVARLAPWIAQPLCVYTSPDAGLAVVELVYDPREAFVEGANLVSRFEIVAGAGR